MPSLLGKNASVIVLILLAVGIFLGVNGLRNQQIIKSQADFGGLQVLSPAPSEVITGQIVVKARVSHPDSGPGKFDAYYTVDGKQRTDLAAKQVDDDVLATGLWDSAGTPAGTHNLEIFVYNNSGSHDLLGKASESIEIK